jgi:PAS domain S-box-containing protein
MFFQLWTGPGGQRKFTFVSDSVRTFYGVTPEEACADARRLYGRIHPEDILQLENLERLAQENMEPLRCVVRVRPLGGDWRRVWLVATPQPGDDGWVRWDGIETALPEVRGAWAPTEPADHFRKIINVDAIGILIAGYDGRIFEANDYYLRLVGHSREELADGLVDWRAVTPAEWQEVDNRHLEALRRTQEAQSYEKEYLRRDGTRVSVYLSISLMPGPDERIAAFALDMTERKAAELALRESDEKLAIAFQIAPFALVISRLNDGRYLAVNEAHTQLTGYRREETLGKNVHELKVWADPRQRAEIADDLRKGETVSGREVDFRDRLGSVHTCLFSARIFHLGDEECMLSCVADISERKRVEKENQILQSRLAQAQKMEAIGTLAGGIAHDFNNILSAINGYVELAGAKAADEDQRSDLEMVMSASRRAGELVQRILAFSRSSQEEARPIQPMPVVQEALKLMRASLPSTVEIRGRLLSKAVVLAEPGEIHRIVVNLCTNAALAMERNGGVLEVELDEVDLDSGFTSSHPEVAAGRFVRLSVRDNGCGMPREVQERMFEPYFTTRENGRGSGMGLAVVHGVVQRRGGTISVSSAPGQGTTMQVLLPVEQRNDAIQKSAALSPQTGNERILFVDDEPMLADLAGRSLGRLGYAVTTYTNPTDALARFEVGPQDFDILVTDLTMPKMTGEALAEAVRRRRPDLPVILCSGYSERVRDRKNGGKDWTVFKPVLAADLSRVIRAALQGTEA